MFCTGVPIINKIWLVIWPETLAFRIIHLCSVAFIMNFAAPEHIRKECASLRKSHVYLVFKMLTEEQPTGPLHPQESPPANEAAVAAIVIVL